MFTISPDQNSIEEILRKNWPTQGSETTIANESEWEILNDNNSNEAINRHWFKQNFIDHMPRQNQSVTYH